MPLARAIELLSSDLHDALIQATDRLGGHIAMAVIAVCMVHALRTFLWRE